MNIAFVNATHNWGGVKTWTLDFAEQLQLRGHTIRVYGRQQAFIEQAQKRLGHGEIVSFGADCNPFTIAAFRRRFTKERVQVVICNVSKDIATAGLAAKLCKCAVVQRIGLPEDIAYSWKTALLHHIVRPHFLSPCRFIETGFLHSLPYLQTFDSKVILNAKTPTNHSLQAGSPRKFVMTQQLFPDKDHASVIRALANLDSPYELHIAGVGPLRDELEQLTRELAMDHKVIWHDFVKDIPHLLQGKDFFLLPSLSEGLPNTLLEAMAAGLLPIIRNVGGVKEVIPPELDSWVLPYDAVSADFAKVIKKALHLEDAALLNLRESARCACRERFNISKNAAQMEAWLLSLVQQ